MIKKNFLFLLAFVFSILANSQTLVNQEFLNNFSGTAGVTELKDSLLFISGTKSGNKQFTANNNLRGVIIFDADSPNKIINIISADASTNITDYISDGSGGFYISGYFSVFNGQTILSNAVLRLKSDMTVIKTSVVFSGTINKITLFNDRVIATGPFNALNGATCPNIAAFDTANLQLIPSFVPGYTTVTYNRSILYKTQLLLLGSYTVSGINYKMIGVDPLTGNVVKTYSNISFTPSIGCVWNDILFLCSDVKITSPASHGYLYSYNLLNMTLSSSRNIKSNAPIYAINIVNQRLFISIYKSANRDTITINGNINVSQGLATVNLNQATLEPPRFNVDDQTFKIIGYGNQFFRCGVLNQYLLNAQNNFIATDTVTNTVLNPNFPLFKAQPNNVCVSANRGMVDYFLGVNFEPRFVLGLLNMKTLNFMKFNPKIDVPGAGIIAIKAVDSMVFIAGNLTNAEGIPINNFVAYNYFTNQIDTNHKLKFNAIVNAMEVLNDSIMLIGGQFTSVNNTAYSSYVAYNYRAKKIAMNYLAGFNGTIFRIVRFDSTIFFTGNFTTVNQINKKGLISAKVNGSSLLFDYGNFITNNTFLYSVRKCDQKYYFLSTFATDTNIFVFDDKGLKQDKLCFAQSGFSSYAPLKNYMVYGGSFTNFAGLNIHRYLVAMRCDNNRSTPDNSFLSYLLAVNQMVSWGDSVIFYFTTNGLHRIRFNPLQYIESPIMTSDFSCKQTGNSSYRASGAFNTGNSFHLEASTTVTFLNPILLGSVSSTANQGTIPVNLSSLTNSTSYFYRIRSTNPVILGTGTAPSTYKRSIGSVTLISGPTNCMAYSFGTYAFSIVSASSSSFVPIIENYSFTTGGGGPNTITVKWKDGPIGKIKIAMVDNNGCSIDTCIVVVNISQSPYGGINYSLKKQITVFPNVFDNELNIQNEDHHQLDIVIKDPNGKVVIQKEINESDRISTSNLASGFYIIIIRNEHESVILKLVKR